jgi:DNA repair protein RAD16
MHVAIRTATQIQKGKYVESDDEENFMSASVVDDSADEDFVEEGEMSDVKIESPPPFYDDSDDDIYGEQIPIPSTSKVTPVPAKKRKLTNASATPVSAKSKTSANSSVFSPADSVDTPVSSVSGSIRKTLRGVKRKLETPSNEDEESEFEPDEEELEAEESDEDEDFLSIAPTVSADQVPFQYAATPPPRPRPIPRSARKWADYRQLSQWEKTNTALCNHHPELVCIWDELATAPLITAVKLPQPKGLSLQLLPFQLEGLDWLLKQEKQTRFVGGILADEMGMGKTIQTIALLLAEPRGKPNLVVAPTVALMQWKSEIEQHTDNGLSVCLFYGANRNITAKEMKEYDVVLTTCTTSPFPHNLVSFADVLDAVLESVFRKQHTGFKRADGIHKERSLLHSVEFFRVILDEAHNIKDRACNTAKAAFALQTSRKLCLSGTPLQNRVHPIIIGAPLMVTDRRIILIIEIPRSRSIRLLLLQKMSLQRSPLAIFR